MPPMIVDFEGVQELIARGAQLVEVLPKHEYRELHLPRAINVPLSELDACSAQRLDRGRPVVVYCWDALCDLSPRAAAHLDQFGFEAYDYALSKVDWMARGLPVEGSTASEPRPQNERSCGTSRQPRTARPSAAAIRSTAAFACAAALSPTGRKVMPTA